MYDGAESPFPEIFQSMQAVVLNAVRAIKMAVSIDFFIVVCIVSHSKGSANLIEKQILNVFFRVITLKTIKKLVLFAATLCFLEK
jgi:hypothetical protein